MAVKRQISPRLKSRKRKQTTMRLHPEVAPALAKEAEARGMSATMLNEQVLARYLREQGHEIALKDLL